LSKNLKREELQKEALQAVQANGGSGILCLATGVGKSKIAIDYCKVFYTERKNKFKCLLVVPTEKLRDTNWHDEFIKWKSKTIYSNCIERTCYASFNKIKNKEYDLVILDEIHRGTEHNFKFFKNNKTKNILGLTATYPKDEIKQELLKEINLPVVYSVSLDDAVKNNVVAPYKIKVIELFLDDKDKYIQAGSKTKSFMTTEYGQYQYVSNMINKILYSGRPAPAWLFLKRMHLIYNLRSKTQIAKKVIESIPKDERTLIFCGSISQAEELCKNSYHSKSDDKSFNKFCNEEINQLSCVNALNEGQNIPNLDNAVIVQLNSNELSTIQRIGRCIRYRPGHEATIYILSVVQTQDEKWVKKALENFDTNNIEYVSYKNYLK